ncbi:MAG: NUDIX hydrolase [Candidatus Portnoybacteria bacterium]|nr:NUDIX hydrolase [Candidatus Portnoybacteria bacterium]
MELQVGVKIFLENRKGKYLILKRSVKKYPEAGSDLWDIVGGRIEPGSTLIENLKREVKEETSLDLEEEPKLLAAQDILRVQGRHVVRLTYQGNIEGDPILDEDHEEFRWASLEELERLKNLDRYAKELLANGLIK